MRVKALRLEKNVHQTIIVSLFMVYGGREMSFLATAEATLERKCAMEAISSATSNSVVADLAEERKLVLYGNLYILWSCSIS